MALISELLALISELLALISELLALISEKKTKNYLINIINKNILLNCKIKYIYQLLE